MTESEFPEQRDRRDGGGHSPSSPPEDAATPVSPEAEPAEESTSTEQPSDGGHEHEALVTEPIHDELAALRHEIAERTEDLQRLQAEYVNYRKRVDRDRLVARDLTVVAFVEAFLPMLDDLDSARQHGELTEGTPLAAIAEKFEAVLSRFGWERYGTKGEPFDPNIHEALLHSHSPDVTETTVSEVLQPGHRAGERIVRAARVAVVDPED